MTDLYVLVNITHEKAYKWSMKYIVIAAFNGKQSAAEALLAFFQQHKIFINYEHADDDEEGVTANYELENENVENGFQAPILQDCEFIVEHGKTFGFHGFSPFQFIRRTGDLTNMSDNLPHSLQ